MNEFVRIAGCGEGKGSRRPAHLHGGVAVDVTADKDKTLQKRDDQTAGQIGVKLRTGPRHNVGRRRAAGEPACRPMRRTLHQGCVFVRVTREGNTVNIPVQAEP